ncbi:MAG: histidine phosphatase family protein [Armatimonadota bacterium]
MKTIIWLVRHGETDYTASGRMQGHTDVPLNAAGRRQAQLLAASLAEAGLTAIHCSDLRRARETAEIIGRGAGPKPKARPELRERGYGSWEGLTVEAAKAERPDLVAQWFDDFDRFCPPQGEDTLALRRRVLTAFQDIVAESDGRRIAIVGHAGPLKEILCHALGVPAVGRRRIQLAPASVTVLTIDGGTAHLELLNDTCHLRASREAD